VTIPTPPSLPALATVTDVANRMPRELTAAETTRSAFLLTDASERIRSFTKQTFNLIQTAEVIAPVDNQIILPQRPTISIDGLARVDPTGNAYMPYSIYTWDGAQTIMLGPPSAVINAPEFWVDNDWFWRNVTYLVTYTHGYSVIPDKVVGVCATMVMRVLLAPGSPGVVGETIGGYSYRMADGVPLAAISMTSDDEEVLKPFCARKNRTIEFR
jgi:hypothetical protein